ncbi:translation initiation factor IF-3 [Lujinxingia vulgaris]|uniref:Translation initiation factor IF-3 n=1 Tax=Lujinxingia vulgaris TaxID=2600176 RepID=A0A5C6X3A3_9DELT|nr:translation initiation factor IF-3 [Lujinxingia vulgaris]
MNASSERKKQPTLEEVIIRRSNHNDRNNAGQRVNHSIRASEVRVISPDGEQLGIMHPNEARDKAKEFGLDLVEVAPNSRPPVCRIMDFGKYQYDQSKKAAASRSTRVQLKTVQLRPNTDDHDMDVKLRRAKKFLEGGNQVRFVMRMRGRERAYTQRWVEHLGELLADFSENYETPINVVSSPRGEGWRIHAIVEPASTS